MKLTLSSRVSKLGESLTIAISTKAKQMKAQGQDVVILSAGEPDFDTAEVAKRAVIEAMAKGCGKYTPVAGTPEILNLIAQKLKRDNGLNYRPDQIITNVGAKHSLFNAFNCILNEGDEVIIPAPYWVTYPEIVKFCGGKPVIVDTKAENRYKITASQLKAAITPRTKALCLFNPSDEIGEFSIPSLRENIGLVSQRVYIFNDTIAQNVSYGAEFNEQRVIEALKLANAYEFVSSMRDGIYTVLSEFGANLSGGQRQRIAIARALYKDPQILIFDEATSALDNASEKGISNVIEKIKQSKIIFVIAHRLSTIERADNIAVMKNGRILAIGTDAKLTGECEEYRSLKGIMQNG